MQLNRVNLFSVMALAVLTLMFSELASAQVETKFILARYNAQGSLDNSFENNGRLATDFVTSSAEGVNDIAIAQNGKIVAAGYAVVGGERQFALARYNTDGSLDTTFSNDGKLCTSVGSRGEAMAVAIDSSGRIIAAGEARVGASAQFVVVRYLQDGSLDEDFDGDGKAFAFSNLAYANAVVIDGSGKIIVGGDSYVNGAGYQFALARFNTDGSLDNTFSQDGRVNTTFPSSSSSEVTDLAIDQNGKIVAVGWGGFSNSERDARFTIARYLSDGSLDSGFDGDGKVITNFASIEEMATGVAIDQDNKIVVGGYAHYPDSLIYDDAEFVVARYNTNGSPDATFSGGRARTYLSTYAVNAGNLVIDANGKIILAGGIVVGDRWQVALVRFTRNGTLDTSFDGDGIRISNLSYNEEWANAVRLDASGRIVVGGVMAIR